MTIRNAGISFWHDYNRSGTLTFKVKMVGSSRYYRSDDPPPYYFPQCKAWLVCLGFDVIMLQAYWGRSLVMFVFLIKSNWSECAEILLSVTSRNVIIWIAWLHGLCITREIIYREALLFPRHVEFWTSGASSDRRYFSDKPKLSGCPHVIVYMCAHGWNELPILVLYVTWSHTLLLINTLIVHIWYRRTRIKWFHSPVN